MKNYLDLIPISAAVHRKQTRMTRLCIVLAVFLVTVIFSMADMEMRSQMIQAVKSYGNWHAAFLVDAEKGALIGARPEVDKIARYGVVNYGLKDGYQIEGVETCVCGLDQNLLEMFPEVSILEGSFPKQADEAVLNMTIKSRLGVQVGDTVELSTPQGRKVQFTITGITEDTALEAKHDAFGMLITIDGFDALDTKDTDSSQEILYYVAFRSFCNIQKAIGEITARFELKPDQVRQNTQVLTLMLQSRDPYMMQFYFVAATLAVLVAAAGILMITSSMNSNIARRTEFFGMLRCLGATGKQVVRFVKKEALGWCRSAIPIGVMMAVVVVWALCGMLRLLSPGLFEGMPVFGVSIIGIVSGVIVGIITVLLAARSPARKAAQVSPLTAVSGNAGTLHPARKAANTGFFKVDIALGIHHASGSRKNFLLVTGSFAFSIILFLAFSTAIDFMHHALIPLRPQAPDFYAYDGEYRNVIPAELSEKLQEYPGVKRAYGRGYTSIVIPVDGQQAEVTILSYDEQQFKWARKDLLEGNFPDAVEGRGVLLAYRENNPFTVGSRIAIDAGGTEPEVSVAGILRDIPFSYGKEQNVGSSEIMMICSEEMFRKLTGETGYAVLDIQMEADIEDDEVFEIRREIEQTCGTEIAFSDRRISNRETRGAGYSLAVFLYGFLGIIALIAFFNIINCIAMSVSARMREYGAMRAIGMSVRQLFRMVVGETVTYAASGVVLGCAVGLPINRMLFQSLVTYRWGDAWELPGWELIIIVAVMFVAVCLSVAGPVRQIREMSVVDTVQ